MRHRRVIFPEVRPERDGAGLRLAAAAVSDERGVVVTVKLQNVGEKPIALGRSFASRLWVALGDGRDVVVTGAASLRPTGAGDAERIGPRETLTVELIAGAPGGEVRRIRAGLDANRAAVDGVFGEWLGPLEVPVSGE